MSKAYDDSRYLARTLAASLIELAPEDQVAIVSFLKDELRRLGIPEAPSVSPMAQERGGHAVTAQGESLNSGASASPN
ncbi:MAG: hypothetical protein MUC37_07085 [Hyphomicrobium sp.]|jgi:hypothetical protein|nr:hypothetical protein [Hyphomicrobium sp.]